MYSSPTTPGAPGPEYGAGHRGFHLGARPLRATIGQWFEPGFLSPRSLRLIRLFINVNGAAGAAYFAFENLRVYFQTHHLIGVAFFAVQMWVVIAYLVRRPARAVTRRPRDWLLAFAGTFGGVLFLPFGSHPGWGLRAGLDLQLIGLAICVASFLTLGRSFGFAAADRGLVRRGPYAVVRHPIYGSYVFLQLGYVLQSISLRNVLVMLFVTGCNVGRALAEERLLSRSRAYADYRARVRWRLIPGVW